MFTGSVVVIPQQFDLLYSLRLLHKYDAKNLALPTQILIYRPKMKDLRELYQNAASTSFLMSEDEISQMLSPEQLENTREARRLRLSQQNSAMTPKTSSISQRTDFPAQQ